MENRIREIRKSKGLSQQALADRIGTTSPTIMKLEKGSMNLTANWMGRISNGLECEPEDLISSNGPKISYDEDLMKKSINVAMEYGKNIHGIDLAQLAVWIYQYVKDKRKAGLTVEADPVVAELVLLKHG